MTPLDFHDRLLSFKGAGFGLEPLLLQSAGSARTTAART
jgi:phytoene desaturase